MSAPTHFGSIVIARIQRLTILPRSDGHARADEAAAAGDATKKQHQLRGRARHYSAAICSSAAGTATREIHDVVFRGAAPLPSRIHGRAMPVMPPAMSPPS